MIAPDASRAEKAATPFPHFRAPAILDRATADGALRWLRDEADWRLRVEDFYEQHEIDLVHERHPAIAPLVTPSFIDAVRDCLIASLPHGGELELASLAAHRLTHGQTIRIHNDDLGGEESHRLLIQLNEGWNAEMGGLLMLFAGDRPETLAAVIAPEHGSGFGFRISAGSHHAVSTVRSGCRFTLVYTFRERA